MMTSPFSGNTIKINNVQFNVSLYQILTKLKEELSRRGIKRLDKIKPIKDYIMVTCPYHKNGQESRPSAQLREKDGIFYCFTCKETHSLPEVISHCLHENGWNWLLKNFISIEIDERKVELNFGHEVKQESFIDKYELLKYRFTHPYMFKRKLTLDTIRKFDIGYDKETDCITFPVKDKKGNILFFARRSVNKKYFNYPYGAEKPIYGEYELLRELKTKPITEVYVCESMLDALAIWSWGKYAVALNGLGSDKQLKLLEQLPVRVLILATDNDDAGRNARANIYSHIKTKLIKEIDYSSYGDCKDINDMTKEQFNNCKIIFYNQR